MSKKPNMLATLLLSILTVVFLLPIGFIIMNSFKGRLFISDDPFALPNSKSFVALSNYIAGIKNASFFKAFGTSLFITVFSVMAILVFTSMAAYYITRVHTKLTSAIYYLFAFSMIVPFQMVMFTMTKLADMANLTSPAGMIVLYLGFGAGLSVFLFSGFIKSIPLEIEKSAMIDGCNPLQTFILIVVPILKPTAITVAILNTMWIWNDYLLPYLVIPLKSPYKPIPVVVQYLVGSYGSKDMGQLMALLVLAIIPIVIFYLACQKYIIEGVVAGAVKG